MSCRILPFSEELRPRLPTILGYVDYHTLQRPLQQIDGLLRQSGVEHEFVPVALDRWISGGSREPSVFQQTRFQRRSRRALRCNLLRTLLQEDFRGFSIQLAGNPLYQWFCGIDALDVVRVPSKSELQRYAHWLPAPELRRRLDGLLRQAAETPARLELTAPLDLEAYFLDSTALKVNIHFPTDWVLLRDAVRTLMKATLLIGREGLRRRMEAPEVFLARMNTRCMAMSQAARRAGSGS